MKMFTRLVITRQKLVANTMGPNAYLHAAVLWRRSAIRFRGAIYHGTYA